MGGGGWPSPTSRKAEKGVGTLTWLILKIVFLRCLVYLLIQCLIVKWIVHAYYYFFVQIVRKTMKGPLYVLWHSVARHLNYCWPHTYFFFILNIQEHWSPPIIMIIYIYIKKMGSERKLNICDFQWKLVVICLVIRFTHNNADTPCCSWNENIYASLVSPSWSHVDGSLLSG